MMAVALVYRVLVCVYETICIWGAGGATPGKFLLGLRVVTCDTSTLVRPNRVLVVPASNVSLSASAVRALNKNFSIAFLFPVFITLLFFQHNRTVYDIVAGTIVVQRRGGRQPLLQKQTLLYFAGGMTKRGRLMGADCPKKNSTRISHK